MPLNTPIYFPSKDHSFIKSHPGKRLTTQAKHQLKRILRVIPEQSPFPATVSIIYGWFVPPLILSPALSKGTEEEALQLECAVPVFLVFLSSGKWWKVEVGRGVTDEGQMKIFDLRSRTLLLPWHKNPICPVLPHADHFSRAWQSSRHTRTFPTSYSKHSHSPGNIREPFGLPLPLHLFEGSREHSPLSTKIKKGKSWKEPASFFLSFSLIYCCIREEEAVRATDTEPPGIPQGSHPSYHRGLSSSICTGNL